MPALKGFRPPILHPLFLLTLIAVSLALVGLLEYGCRSLPNSSRNLSAIYQRRDIQSSFRPDGEETVGRVIEIVVQTSLTSIEPSNNVARVVNVPRVAEPDRDTFPNTSLASDSTPSIQPTPTALEVMSTTGRKTDPNAHLQITGTYPIKSSYANPSAYLQITYTSSDVTASSASSDAFLQMTPTFTQTVSSANPNAHLQTDVPETAPNSDQYLRIDSHKKYFVGAYLPTIIAVFFALPWIILGRTIISLEPFRQLCRPQGTIAELSLTADMYSWGVAFSALKNGQWSVVLSIILMLLSALITPLAPETIAIDTIGDCNHKTKGCGGTLAVLRPAARAIQAILAVMVVLSFVLIILLQRRTIELAFDPRSIAAHGCIFSDANIKLKFKEFGLPDSNEKVKASLAGHMYKIDSISRGNGVKAPSIVMMTRHPKYSTNDIWRHNPNPSSSNARFGQLTPRHRLGAASAFIFLAALMVVIIVYHYTGGETGFENFMSGGEFGVRFLFAWIGILISWYWSVVFLDIAHLVPFSSLAAGNATAKESILLMTPAHALVAVKSAISARHFVYFIVILAAILSEVLTITLATIPFSSATLYNAYVVSTWISVSIIVVMLLVLVILFFYREPTLPVMPNSIAGKLVYLVDSSLPDMFADVVAHDTGSWNKKIEGLGFRYGLKLVRDGAGALSIDIE